MFWRDGINYIRVASKMVFLEVDHMKSKIESFLELAGIEDAFKNFADTIYSEGALSTKEKAVIALACAVAIRCRECTKAHAKMALDNGANRDELLEAAAIAGLVRTGSGFNTASTILEELEK